MSSAAHILPAPESATHPVLRYAGRWIGWTGISVLLTVASYCVVASFVVDPVRADAQEVAAASVHTPSQWQVDELAVLER